MTDRLRVAFWNCQGLTGGKERSLLDYISGHKIDIIFLAETWLKKTGNIRLHRVIAEFGYQTNYQDGMACIAHENIANEIELVKIDSVNKFIKIKLGKTNLIGLYFPPKMGTSGITNLFKEIDPSVRILDSNRLVILLMK